MGRSVAEVILGISDCRVVSPMVLLILRGLLVVHSVVLEEGLGSFEL